jgi:hypothetical protein
MPWFARLADFRFPKIEQRRRLKHVVNFHGDLRPNWFPEAEDQKINSCRVQRVPRLMAGQFFKSILERHASDSPN